MLFQEFGYLDFVHDYHSLPEQLHLKRYVLVTLIHKNIEINYSLHFYTIMLNIFTDSQELNIELNSRSPDIFEKLESLLGVATILQST